MGSQPHLKGRHEISVPWPIGLMKGQVRTFVTHHAPPYPLAQAALEAVINRGKGEKELKEQSAVVASSEIKAAV